MDSKPKRMRKTLICSTREDIESDKVEIEDLKKVSNDADIQVWRTSKTLFDVGGMNRTRMLQVRSLHDHR
jgi:hypothetical protein